MPLRDHFHAPIFKRHAWEGFHGQWPAMIVLQLVGHMPKGYIVEPRVHLGAFYEIDVTGFESDGAPPPGGGLVTTTAAPAAWAVPAPTATLDAGQPEPYEYEVLVYDENRARRLVAAVEIVSPANKDRPDHRKAFVTKCAALLRNDVCVSIVDPVTLRHGNLYVELLASLDLTDPTFGPDPPELYAVTCRQRTGRSKTYWDTWAYALELGRALPTLPLWLAEDYAVPLDLEATYEQTCRALGIP
ncbi:DUF4058 family protein [Gemmata sp.]|uniref:DUF4058 family protein n=1 Tax=Gemmata sp. TaxID=1914242 RepID=UPI003F707210